MDYASEKRDLYNELHKLRGALRDDVAKEAKSVMNYNNSLVQEIKARQDDLDSKFDLVDTELAKLKRPQLWGDGPDQRPSAESKAFNKWARRGDKGIGPEETKVLTVTSDPAFGAACPTELSSQIYSAIQLANPMRGLARIYQTHAISYEILKRNSSAVAAYQTTDISEMTETTGLSWDKITITPKTSYYNLHVSLQNLEDSQYNLESEFSSEIGEKLGALEANQMVNGTTGLIANVSDTNGALNTYVELHAGSTTVISAEKLVDLCYLLPLQYHQGASWIMNRATMGLIRQIKDAGTGTFLLAPLTSGVSPTLMGYPVILDDYFPAATSDLYPVGFGQWNKAFVVVDRFPQFQLQRFAERYAEFGIVMFLCRQRSGFSPLDGAAAVFLQMSA